MTKEFLMSLDPERGNALDNLTKALRNAVANRSGEYGWEECAELADKILRQHAAELAEELRELAREADGPLPTLQEYVRGLRHAADHVAPEAQR